MDTRKPTYEWTPIHVKSQMERGAMPKFTLKWLPGLERNEQIETTARQLLERSVSYLKKLYGDDYPTARNFLIEITHRKQHGATGATIKLSHESLASFESLNEQEKDQEQSLIVHELVHNFRDEEDLSMLAELTYMLEKGHVWRLTNLAKIRGEGRLPAPYEIGLSTIAQWLGITMDQLLDPNEPKDLEQMQKVFRREIDRIVEETKREQSV
ncbi:MAG: hypothetical protein NUV84_01605 [Candidatus Uhrbacteria bacterium]|nr:hypothetical protein [Candidatus Uhrbacteria bacterium]